MAASLCADDIRIGRFWQRNVTLEDVVDGQIVFTDSVGTEQVKKLSKVSVLKVPAYAALGQAHEAIAAGDDEKAVTLLSPLVSRVRQPWLKHWIVWHRAQAQARLGQHTASLNAYLGLARSGADAFYLKRPPLEGLGNASKRQKSDLRKRLASARSRLQGPAADGVQKMLDRIGPDLTATPDNGDAEPTSMERSEASAGATTRTPPATLPDDQVDHDTAPTAEDLAASAVVLPRYVRHNDRVTRFLRAGEFDYAIARVDKLLAAERATHVNMRWFQRGIARRALADTEPNALRAEALYKRAGLDFMRVVVYFPSGRYRAACLVEIGYVHHKIGRADKARELYAEAAQGSSAIKAKTEPEYFERLEELRTMASRE